MLRSFLSWLAFEICEMFISLIFKFFSGRGKPGITETVDTGPMDTGTRLYTENLVRISH
jgi:hypothetical protein